MPSPTYVPVIRTGVPVEFTEVAVVGATAATDAITTEVTGDAAPRFIVDADGTHRWSDGTGAPDILMRRYAAGGLETDGAFRLTAGQMLFRPDGSVNLYSSAAGVLHTDDSLDVDGGLTVDGVLGVGGAVGLGGAVTSTRAAGTDVVLGSLVTADTFDRFRIDTNGAHSWGSGAAARNVGLSRGGDNLLDVTTADLRIATAGRGLRVAEGANAKSGLAVLVAGTVTVNTTAVGANSRIQLTSQVDGGTPGFQRVSARVAGTSFTITSSNAADTSSVAWLIVDP